MNIKLLFAFFVFSTWQDSNAQEKASYPCDKKYLDDEAYSKCLSDSAWQKDIIILNDYFIFLQKKIFPEFRVIRKQLNLSERLESELASFRLLYDSTLNLKLEIFKRDMYKNQKFVQPNAYLSTLLSFELFNLYPDIYAILLNPVHLNLRPKTDPEKYKQIEKDVNMLLENIPSGLYNQTLLYSKDLEKKKNEFPYTRQLFQGEIDLALKEKYSVLNFLLWIK